MAKTKKSNSNKLIFQEDIWEAACDLIENITNTVPNVKFKAQYEIVETIFQQLYHLKTESNALATNFKFTIYKDPETNDYKEEPADIWYEGPEALLPSINQMFKYPVGNVFDCTPDEIVDIQNWADYFHLALDLGDVQYKKSDVPPTCSVKLTKLDDKTYIGLASDDVGYAQHALLAGYNNTNSKWQENVKNVRAHKAMNQKVECPAANKKDIYGGCRKTTLDSQIQHLNDNHKWTREKIADWIDTLEEQPIYYPDIDDRTDDEKIDEGLKKKKSEIEKISSEFIDNPTAKAKIIADINAAKKAIQGAKADLTIVDEKSGYTKLPCGCQSLKEDSASSNTICGKCGNHGHICLDYDKCPNAEPQYSKYYKHPIEGINFTKDSPSGPVWLSGF